MLNPYQLLGPVVPKMLGRQAILANIERHLSKPTPPHLQIVGPKLYGKSVLLTHLASKYRSGFGQYLTAAYVDLRHGTPRSDDDFKSRLFSSSMAESKIEVANSVVTLMPG